MRCLVVGDYILDYELRGDDVYIAAVRPGQKPDVAIEVTDDFNFENDDTSGSSN